MPQKQTPNKLSPLVPPIILLLLLSPWYFLYNKEALKFASETMVVLKYAFGVLLWLSLAWLVNRLLKVFFWQSFLAKKLGAKVPRLLIDVVSVLIFFLAIIGIIATVFGHSVTEIVALTGALGFVIGLALQTMISDVFQGIALNIDRPFRIGDWVCIHDRGVKTLVGRVQEVNWRSTRLIMGDDTLLVVPNHRIATLTLQNLSLPSNESSFELIFCLDFAVSHDRALRVLKAGALGADEVVSEPPPKVFIKGVNNYGVLYKVIFRLIHEETPPNVGYTALSSSVLAHLHQAGLSLAYQKHDVYFSKMPQRHLDFETDKRALLSRIEIFKDFDDTELDKLSTCIQRHTLPSGKTIVERGEEGSSMFILVEGLLSVFVLFDEKEGEIQVAQIHPGQFFGEMSLLTGEARSATVTCQTEAEVYEIKKEPIEEILRERPELAECISLTVAARKMRNEEMAQDLDKKGQEEKTHTIAKQIFDKIKSCFSFLS